MAAARRPRPHRGCARTAGAATDHRRRETAVNLALSPAARCSIVKRFPTRWRDPRARTELELLPAATPASVRRLLQRCLERMSADVFATLAMHLSSSTTPAADSGADRFQEDSSSSVGSNERLLGPARHYRTAAVDARRTRGLPHAPRDGDIWLLTLSASKPMQ
jgi:hypothetical protein